MIPVEDGKEGLYESVGGRTPQENQYSQLIWAQRGSQRWKQQPGILHGTKLGHLYTCYNCVNWSSVRFLTVKAGTVSDTVSLFTRLPHPALIEENSSIITAN